MIKYPNGQIYLEDETKIDKRKHKNKTEEQINREHYLKANMGMNFESDVSKSCEYYKNQNLALIYKRPTPIKVVKMDTVKRQMIKEAYFQEKSVTDYVGLYKGKYIDFECKETIHNSIPYKMIREQQYLHLEKVIQMGGIGFFLVSFKMKQEVYLLKASIILDEIKVKHHPGFKYEFFKEKGILVKRGYNPPYMLLDAIDIAFNDILNK